MTHSPSTTPANPAQVTELRAAIVDIVRKFEFGSAIPEYVADEIMKLPSLAAIGAGGQAVAAGVFRDGQMIGFVGLGEEFELPEDTDERRPLYTHPAPSGQAVAAPDAIYAELRAYFERYPTEADEHLGMLACKLSAIAHPVPMEWRLVPEEPTPEMIGAFWRQKNTGTQDIGVPVADKDHSDHAAYRAMLSAAPQPKGE